MAWHYLDVFDGGIRGRHKRRHYEVAGRRVRAGDLLELRFPQGRVVPVTWLGGGTPSVQLRLGGAWEDEGTPTDPAGHRLPLASMQLPSGAQLRWPPSAAPTTQVEDAPARETVTPPEPRRRAAAGALHG